MKTFENIFFVYVKQKGKKSAYLHTSHDGIKFYDNQTDAEQEANNIYTGEQEITIRQAWFNEKGYTGKTIILTYPIIK